MSITEHEVIQTDFALYLDDLRDAARTTIQTLTTIAAESVHAASAVVSAISDHLKSVEPSRKLPTLYLIDSILKNVGGVYIDLFFPKIVKIFSDSFLVSDDPTRQSLIKVLNTWRNHIFSPDVIAQIDTFVRSVPKVHSNLIQPRILFLTDSLLAELNTQIINRKTALLDKKTPELYAELQKLESLQVLVSSNKLSITQLENIKSQGLDFNLDQPVCLPNLSIPVPIRNMLPQIVVCKLDFDQIQVFALEKIYPQNTTKCAQCGRRFLLPQNQKLLDQHMDYHFRTNRKSRCSTIRIQSRLWLCGKQVRIKYLCRNGSKTNYIKIPVLLSLQSKKQNRKNNSTSKNVLLHQIQKSKYIVIYVEIHYK